MDAFVGDLVSRASFARYFEVANQKHEGRDGESDPADEVETIHEAEETGLTLELSIDVRGRGVGGIGCGEAMLLEISSH